MVFSNMVPSEIIRYCKNTIALLGAILLLSTVTDEAEAQQRRSLHRIEIYQQGDMCYYRIQDQVNQEQFRITPLGAVLFQAKGGLKVEIEVDDAEVADRQGQPQAIAGLAGARKTEISDRRPIQSVAVREARGVNSEHKVNIRCCTGRTILGCRWSDAQPSETATGGIPQSGPDLNALLHRGPHASDGSIPVQSEWRLERLFGPGGPVMKIEEDT